MSKNLKSKDVLLYAGVGVVVYMVSNKLFGCKGCGKMFGCICGGGKKKAGCGCGK